ncbi:MAG TPA: hypothetical protein PK076_06830 [Saprospiraceae bacterium]|nr:hypothetical protein [Saprospiraceae bacterium]HQW55823.1 hypothetical protein [Saprospiraceae bacterium]
MREQIAEFILQFKGRPIRSSTAEEILIVMENKGNDIQSLRNSILFELRSIPNKINFLFITVNEDSTSEETIALKSINFMGKIKNLPSGNFSRNKWLLNCTALSSPLLELFLTNLNISNKVRFDKEYKNLYNFILNSADSTPAGKVKYFIQIFNSLST